MDRIQIWYELQGLGQISHKKVVWTMSCAKHQAKQGAGLTLWTKYENDFVSVLKALRYVHATKNLLRLRHLLS